MPKLKEIVSIINTNLETDVFNTSRFQGGKYYDIVKLVSEQIKDNVITRPCEIDNDGECTDVIYDDTYPLQLYHRIMTLNYETVPEDYGDGNLMKETATMSLVFISDRYKIQMESENLMALIAVNMIEKLSQTDLNTYNLYSCSIYPSGESVIDNETIYNREYQNVEYLLKPNSIMHALTYTIETVYNKKCYLPCEEV
jgi:hypothetical protein